MKVLIWDKTTPLVDKGGPSGYLFKLHEFLKLNPDEHITFLSDIVKSGTGGHNSASHTKPTKVSFVRRVINKNKLINFLVSTQRFYYGNHNFSAEEIEIIKSFDYVHFHKMSDFLQLYKDLKRVHVKSILTTHTPEPYTAEYFDMCGMSWLLKWVPGLRSLLYKREIYGYEQCNYIMFPVPQAKEAYTNASKIFASGFRKLNTKFFYVPTAINKLLNAQNEGRLKEITIPDTALKVCYIGRHTIIKGYDALQQIAQSAWEKDSDVHFIIGGKEEPIKGLDDSRWHELGWVNTCNLLKEVDVFILPNKETYYDLILLEILRSGVPVILTETGGNKWFKQYKNTGLFFYPYNDLSIAVNHILKLKELKSQGSLVEYGKKNENLFACTSSLGKYVQSYIKAIDNL